MIKLRCDKCKKTLCKSGEKGKDCHQFLETSKDKYQNSKDLLKILRASSKVESKHYCKATRLEEIALFAKSAGFNHLGMAFCTGLREEARLACELLQGHFQISSVCCKICSLPKKDLKIPKIRKGADEYTCNPFGQAELLNRAGTELNVVVGLCVGHDAIFNRFSNALVTTFIAKDRVLAHNPAAAVYNKYVKQKLQEGVFKPRDS